MSLARQVFALVVTTILAIPVVASAQTERGAISGLVTDETKAAVPGVAIKVINAGTNVAADVVSSDTGSFTVVNLRVGAWSRRTSTPRAWPSGTCYRRTSEPTCPSGGELSGTPAVSRLSAVRISTAICLSRWLLVSRVGTRSTQPSVSEGWS